VFENKSVLPRFFAVPASGIEVIPEPTAQLTRLKQSSFDPQRSVIFSEARGAAGIQTETLRSSIDVVEKGINGYRLRVEFNEPAVVVVSQMYYPGWKATVDGAETPVHPVNVALTGILVPGGSHDVRIFFQPGPFRIGLAISLVSAVIAALLLITPTLIARARNPAS
jgi:hypothetical protein